MNNQLHCVLDSRISERKWTFAFPCSFLLAGVSWSLAAGCGALHWAPGRLGEPLSRPPESSSGPRLRTPEAELPSRAEDYYYYTQPRPDQQPGYNCYRRGHCYYEMLGGGRMTWKDAAALKSWNKARLKCIKSRPIMTIPSASLCGDV